MLAVFDFQFSKQEPPKPESWWNKLLDPMFWATIALPGYGGQRKRVFQPSRPSQGQRRKGSVGTDNQAAAVLILH
jgi:hypothetical protein